MNKKYIFSEGEQFPLTSVRNLSMSGRPVSRGHAFESCISATAIPIDKRSSYMNSFVSSTKNVTDAKLSKWRLCSTWHVPTK